MKRLLLLTLLAVSLAGSAWGQAVQRFALVIGNADYDYNKEVNLVNPVNDARLMATLLTQAGFKVTKLENARVADMQSGITAFVQQLKSSQGVGFFYFAGHGAGLQGEHYLLPSDTVINKSSDIQKTGITLRSVSAQMDLAKSKLNILVIDADANDPFNLPTDSVQRTRLLIPAPLNTVIAVSANPPTNAQDGTGKNGLYTENLARAMVMPGAELRDIFLLTEMEVKRQSAYKQLPWSSMYIEPLPGFYFTQKPAPQADDPKVFGRSARGG